MSANFNYRVLDGIHKALSRGMRYERPGHLFLGRKEWQELGIWLGAQTAAGAMVAYERRPDGAYFRGLLVLEVDRDEFFLVA